MWMGELQMASPISPLSGTRVLVVEDEYYLAADLARALEDAGAEVVGPVGTVADAEQSIAAGAFDCAVLDINLHGDPTDALAVRLHAQGVPYLVATGYTGGSVELSDAPRIEKPFMTSQLIDELVRLTAPPTLDG